MAHFCKARRPIAASTEHIMNSSTVVDDHVSIDQFTSNSLRIPIALTDLDKNDLVTDTSNNYNISTDHSIDKIADIPIAKHDLSFDDGNSALAIMNASYSLCRSNDNGICVDFMKFPISTNNDAHVCSIDSTDTRIYQADIKSGKEKPQQSTDSSFSHRQSYNPCKVCSDRASGFHYGVTSCEGCKGFFRRSIQKQIEYRCLQDGTCHVIRMNRNRCQYCRFKKCLAVGMSRDSVRYGRVPKHSKSQDDRSVSSSDSSLDQSALESRQLAIYDVILSVSQAHHTHCAVTSDKVNGIHRKSATLLQLDKLNLLEGQTVFTQPELERQKMLMWQQLAILVTPSIHSVVEFSKRVPSFSDLSQDDQLILVKAGFFEIWLARMARMFHSEKRVVLFEDGSVIPRNELEIVYSPDFVSSMFEMSSNFSLLSLNDTEVGLFTGIILSNYDRQGLSDMKAVESIQDRLVEALKVQVSRNHSTEENLFPAVLIKLPELRTLGSQHSDIIRWHRDRWGQVELPPLFAEIYDIPKSADDC